MEKKIDLLEFSQDGLWEFLTDLGYESFRAKQVRDWLYKGTRNIDEMTNIPKELRNILKQTSSIGNFKSQHKYVSKDGTVKYLFTLSDGNIIESVLMKYKHGYTVCISSQIGCKMGCKFCASSGPGFVRNLTSGEMINQVLSIQGDLGLRIGNIVIMGIGEPLDNYDNVIKFLRKANAPGGLNISYRKITISTCGLVPKILRLSKEDIPVNLSVSLHASNDKKREEIMPINKPYSIDKIIEACKIYSGKTRRRVTFEYAMIKDFNDFKRDALNLAKKIKGMMCHVNIIPINPVEGLEFKPSSKEKTDKFKNILLAEGINVTIRRELGEDINAACGQLRRRKL